jgi:hypothetical protein
MAHWQYDPFLDQEDIAVAAVGSPVVIRTVPRDFRLELFLIFPELTSEGRVDADADRARA